VLNTVAGLKARKVECNDNVSRGSPTNLNISLVAKIAGVAGTGWINQDSHFRKHKSRRALIPSNTQSQAKAPVMFARSWN
jgi:hypothetical protein